ncbi:MAG: hypothetical protein U0S48_22545 [Solirubrobacteraceae bacterium]
MATKIKRIEMRADAASEARIARGGPAADVGVGIRAAAAGREADRALRDAEQTVMPAEQFDALMASLESRIGRRGSSRRRVADGHWSALDVSVGPADR